MTYFIRRNKMYKLENELNLINFKDIKEFTRQVQNELPDYFWIIPASSSSKYHSKTSLGEGGLVRHTQCAVMIADSLFTITPFERIEKDIIISSLLLHDGLKSGLKQEKHTVHEHPNLMGDFIMDKRFNGIIMDNIRLEISKAIRSHMGQWNENKYSNIVLDKPISKIQRFVHMCDYLASRKFLNMDLGE
jgi:hypothetical protein